MDFSLVIACYCDAPHLFENTMLLARYLSATKLKYELIFVEDSSPDQTKSEVERCCAELQKQNIPFQTIFHEKNIGRGGSVTDGFKIARGEIVGFIDIDLEHKMDAILPMIIEIQDGKADVVSGKRLMLYPHLYPLRSISSYLYRFLMRTLLQFPVTDSETGLKIFRRSALLPILPEILNKHWFWDTEILHRCYLHKLRIYEHKIVFTKNLMKKSTVRLLSDSIRQIKDLFAHMKAVREEKRIQS